MSNLQNTYKLCSTACTAGVLSQWTHRHISDRYMSGNTCRRGNIVIVSCQRVSKWCCLCWLYA